MSLRKLTTIWMPLVLAAFCFAVFAAFAAIQCGRGAEFVTGDGLYYRAMIVSLLDDGDLFLVNNLPYSPFTGQLAIGRFGERPELFVPKHPVILPLVGLPFYWFFGRVGLLICNHILAVLVILNIFALCRLYLCPRVSFAVGMIYAVLSQVLPYSYDFSPDLLSTALLLSGVNLVFRESKRMGSFLFGLSVAVRVSNILFVVPVLLYACIVEDAFRRDWHRALRYGFAVLAFLLIGMTPFFISNLFLFGDILTTGYHRAVIGGFVGALQIQNHVGSFDVSPLANLGPLLFGGHVGLLTTNPIMILAVPGIIVALSHDRRNDLLLLAGVSVLMVLFFSSYRYWDYSTIGNRFLMVPVALSSVFFGLLFEKVRGK